MLRRRRKKPQGGWKCEKARRRGLPSAWERGEVRTGQLRGLEERGVGRKTPGGSEAVAKLEEGRQVSK